MELTKLVLKRIELHNPGLNAIVTLLRDEALERARAADEERARLAIILIFTDLMMRARSLNL